MESLCQSLKTEYSALRKEYNDLLSSSSTLTFRATHSEKELQEDVDKDVKKRTRLLLGTGCILKLSKISIGFRINIENVASKEEILRLNPKFNIDNFDLML